MTHSHAITDLIEWAWFGVIQWIKFVVPDYILTADYVGRLAPDWFGEVKRKSEWRGCTDKDGYPRECWFPLYFEAVALQLGLWIEELAPWARDAAVDLVRTFVGYVYGPYTTFSEWLSDIGNRVGAYIPFGAGSLADAIDIVWSFIPSDIRYGLITWALKFAQATDNAVNWALGYYDATVSYAYGAYYYVLTTGEAIKLWWEATHTWLDNFISDTYAVIRDALGETWHKLRLFAINRLDWVNDIYVHYRNHIPDFFSDPITYLYDRFEDWVLEHLW
jgi:hypothetical protein